MVKRWQLRASMLEVLKIGLLLPRLHSA